MRAECPVCGQMVRVSGPEGGTVPRGGRSVYAWHARPVNQFSPGAGPCEGSRRPLPGQGIDPDAPSPRDPSASEHEEG